MQRYLDSSISLAKIRLKIHVFLFCLPLKGFYRIIYYPNILKFCYLYSVFYIIRTQINDIYAKDTTFCIY